MFCQIGTVRGRKTVCYLGEDHGIRAGRTKRIAGVDDRYEVHRVTEGEYKVGKYALMICLKMDYVSSTEEVISFIERGF